MEVLNEEKFSEEYARYRVSNSPLSVLLSKSSKSSNKVPPPPLAPLVTPTTPGSKNPPTVDSDTYLYIKDVVSGMILQSLISTDGVKLTTICDIITSEVKNIEAMGLQYLLDLDPLLELNNMEFTTSDMKAFMASMSGVTLPPDDDDDEDDDEEDYEEDDDIEVEVEETEQEVKEDAHNKT